jgi:hypothetical protein
MATDTDTPQDKTSGTPDGARDTAQGATTSAGEALQLAQAAGTSNSASAAVTITAPPAGGRAEVTVEPGGRLVFQGVDLATAQIQQFEGGLLITLANGGVIFLAGYTAAAESANPPVIEVAGIGTIDAGQLLAATSGANLDIAPGAGPAAGVAHGGGAAFATFTPGTIGDGLAQGSLQPNEDFLRSPPTHETLPVAEGEEEEAAPVLNSEFSIQISGASSAGTPAQAVILQEDSADLAEVTIAMSGDPLAAGQTATVVITIGGDTENGAPNGDFTQSVADAIAAAANSVNIDAVVSGNTVTLTWDATDPSSFSVLLTANDDALLDSPETLILTLSDPARSGGTAAIVGGKDQATATIEDVDQDIVISISDTQDTISEEAGGSDTFTISLSEAMAAGNTVTVDVDFTTGTDAEDADFVTAAQAALQAAADATAGVSFDGTTLTFTDAFAGTDLSFTVTAADDDLTDSPETLTVTLSNATAANGTATAADAESVTITDLDQDITISISDTQASISEEAGESNVFTISLSEAMAAGNTVTVDVDFTTGTDAEDADFVTAAQAALQAAADATAGVSFDGTTLTFTDAFAGTDLSFTVTAADDDLTDSPETLNITLGNATAVNGTATAADAESVTITDNDSSVSFAVTVDDEGGEPAGAAVSISEENLADNAATFTIEMTGTLALGNSASVVLSFPGTAGDGTDFSPSLETAISNAIAALAADSNNPTYDAGTNTLTFFGGGPTSLSFVVTATDDDNLDAGETIAVNLASASTAAGPEPAITAPTATATIDDTDSLPLQELNGLITTNKNSTPGAKLLLTFTEMANPTNSFQALITVPTGGQKDSSIVIQELTGFTIDNTKQYAVTLEWVDQGNSDEKIIVTSVTLEDVVIQSSGTHQLGDPTASPGGDTKAISAVIVPADPLTHTGGALVQGFTDSIDGTSGNDSPLSDPSSSTNYVFGAAGNDVLEGDSGMSILNGGAGDNILNGNDGNDILVWDRVDLTFDDTYDGGVGTDTLRIDGDGVSLDLSALTNTASLGITSIEVIDLTGTASSGPDNPSTLVVETSGSNVLTLAAEDVIEHSTDNVLTVLGDGNDAVNLQGIWTDAGVAASGFHVYTSVVGPTMVTVQVDAEIVNVNATIL